MDIQTDVDPREPILEDKNEELHDKNSPKNQDKSTPEKIHTDKNTSVQEHQRDENLPDDDDDDDDGDDNGDLDDDDNDQSELETSKIAGSKETSKSKSKAAKNKKKRQAKRKNKKAAKASEEEKPSQGLSQQESTISRGAENNSYKESIQDRAQEPKTISKKDEVVVIVFENRDLFGEDSQHFTPGDDEDYMNSLINSMSVSTSDNSEI